MSVLQELKEQRSRIRGESGWQWVPRQPHTARECCAVLYGTIGMLSTSAVIRLGAELRKMRPDHPYLGMGEYNDTGATHAQIEYLFDVTIAAIEREGE